MIESFRHKGLKEFYESGKTAKLDTRYLAKLKLILFRLDRAEEIEDMRYPASGLHGLKGNLEGFYAVKVMRNWRLIFRFEDANAFDIDLIDYH